MLSDVQFSIVKPYEPEVDGYTWLHGVSFAWHKNVLYASWGHNKGKENTATEVVQGRISKDDGISWSPTFMIAPGTSEEAVSHGVMLEHQGELLLFAARFSGKRQNLRTELYALDDQTSDWQSRGIVIDDAFWPMVEPRRMDDGNYIMPGLLVGDGNPAAVAISHGQDLTQWDVVAVPIRKGLGIWGECSLLIDGPHIVNIARSRGQTVALVSVSEDYGRTWSVMDVSNMPMIMSQPYSGVLSTGQHYLICTTTADSGNRRMPLTIAVTRPGELLFSQVFRIRDEMRPGQMGGPANRAAYPYAIERDGKLYVMYSLGQHQGNENSAELAVFPVSQLLVDGPDQRQGQP